MNNIKTCDKVKELQQIIYDVKRNVIYDFNKFINQEIYPFIVFFRSWKWNGNP